MSQSHLCDPNAPRYSVVYDPEQVIQFLNQFIPSADTPHLCIVLNLFSRRKYAPEMKNAEHILQRICVNGGKSAEDAVRKLIRLHSPIGTFVEFDPAQPNGVPIAIPNESLALYASLDIKDSAKAVGKVLTDTLASFTEGAKRRFPLTSLEYEIANTNAVSMNNNLIQIDFDTKDHDQVQRSIEVFRKVGVLQNIVCAVETKNGYHIVYRNDRDKIDGKTLHEYRNSTNMTTTTRTLQKLDAPIFSFTRHPIIVVPGTLQGGFKVKFTNIFQ